jgi:hypothetical protein
VRLRASIRRATGNTRHVIHVAESNDVASQIAWVEIEPADGAYSLFYFSANGECLADTWHESAESAKAQARFEFEIEETGWTDVHSSG